MHPDLLLRKRHLELFWKQQMMDIQNISGLFLLICHFSTYILQSIYLPFFLLDFVLLFLYISLIAVSVCFCAFNYSFQEPTSATSSKDQEGYEI